MAFRVLFWNIENYIGGSDRTQDIVTHLDSSQPDIVAFSEIKDKAALRSILQGSLNNYDFGITDGPQGIELLAGWNRNSGFGQALFTQRREFKAGNEGLRPGSLLSIERNGQFYNFLFLHTDSGRTNRDFTNRQDMFEKTWSLKEKLEEIEGSPTRFIVMGDLNTMGRKAAGGQPAIDGEGEISMLSDDALTNGMKLLSKNHEHTWARVQKQGTGKGTITLQSNLDHALISDAVSVSDIGGHDVLVRGWVDATSNEERFNFVEGISDHCSIEIVIDN